MRMTINELVDCYAGIEESLRDQGEEDIADAYSNVIKDLLTLHGGGMPERLLKWLDPQQNWKPHEERK